MKKEGNIIDVNFNQSNYPYFLCYINLRTCQPFSCWGLYYSEKKHHGLGSKLRPVLQSWVQLDHWPGENSPMGVVKQEVAPDEVWDVEPWSFLVEMWVWGFLYERVS